MIKRLLLGLSRILAFGSFIYSIIMGTIYFETLNEIQMKFLITVMGFVVPFIFVKIFDGVRKYKNPISPEDKS